MKWIVKEQQRHESDYNAGSKARADVERILCTEGFEELTAQFKHDTSQSTLYKAFLQLSRYFEWTRCFRQLHSGDKIVIQFPVRNHTVFFRTILRALKKKGIFTICVIHDLEALRQATAKGIPILSRIRFKLEETLALNYFNKIIVHNDRMMQAMNSYFGIPKEKMVSLGIFDYLDGSNVTEKKGSIGDPIVIAGNLDKRKSQYIYELPEDINCILYGANYDDSSSNKKNIMYKGKVAPDILPSILNGSFGLVWDGTTIDTCDGVYGSYLKINNPHKVSLYLEAGIPVVVWDQSAIADFIRQNHCGIAIGSIRNLRGEMMKLSSDSYNQLRLNARDVGSRLRTGTYLKEAISKCERNDSNSSDVA